MKQNIPKEVTEVASLKLGYIMSRFPKIQETFVLYEILALRRQGASVEVYPLLRERQKVVHPEAEEMAKHAHYHPFLSFRILRANCHFMSRQPKAYFRALAEVLRGTWGSVNFFFGAIGIFPKAVCFAYEMAAQGIMHVHAHFSNHPAVAALIIHRLTGIPFSFTAHGHDIHIERRMLAEKIEAAAFAVTISSYNKRLMIEECGEAARDKIHIIHCGTDTEVFAPRPDASRDGQLRIICVSGFWEVKGHTYLIEACRLLMERGVNFVCHLVGDGSGRRGIEAQVVESGLQENVILHGACARPEVAEILSSGDVIVQPSVPTPRGAREGIPVSLMEGMASGLAVVASGISGIPELVEEGRSGYLTPPRDATALANALQKLSKDEVWRRRMGQAAREKVLREFNLHRNAAKLADLFTASVNQRAQEELAEPRLFRNESEQRGILAIGNHLRRVCAKLGRTGKTH